MRLDLELSLLNIERTATLAEVGQLRKAAPKSLLPFNLPPVCLTSVSSDRVS